MDGANALAIVALAASIGVGLVFVVAGAAKLRHRALLPGVIANYRVLPASLVAPVAVALPYVELTIGLAIAVGIRPAPQAAGILLLLAFAGAMAVNIRRGRSQIDCGCGWSGLRQSLSAGLVGRNLVLAALLVPRIVSADVTGTAPIIVAAFGGFALLLCCLVFNAVRALPRVPMAPVGASRR